MQAVPHPSHTNHTRSSEILAREQDKKYAEQCLRARSVVLPDPLVKPPEDLVMPFETAEPVLAPARTHSSSRRTHLFPWSSTQWFSSGKTSNLLGISRLRERSSASVRCGIDGTNICSAWNAPILSVSGRPGARRSVRAHIAGMPWRTVVLAPVHKHHRRRPLVHEVRRRHSARHPVSREQTGRDRGRTSQTASSSSRPTAVRPTRGRTRIALLRTRTYSSAVARTKNSSSVVKLYKGCKRGHGRACTDRRTQCTTVKRLHRGSQAP
jgi:hypothetical protein